MSDLLEDTLDWLVTLSRRFPPEVETQARLLLLDTLGCLIAGLNHPPAQAVAQALSESFAGDLGWPGSETRLAPAGAAALGAMAACWDEACEGLASAHGRPGLPIAPTILALGRNLPLAALLDALVIGYEIGGRMGQAWPIKPGMHVDGGYHSVGVASAVARLRGAERQGLRDAISATACQIPASLYLPITQGSNVRNLYPAHAALLGVLAGEAAASGMTAPLGAVEKARAVVLGLDSDPTKLSAPGHWLILDGYLKPFAAVRHVHYGVTAALALRPRLSTPDAIRAIRLTIYEEASRYCGNRAPQSVIQAQFSLSFGVAAALLYGDLAPEAYHELGNPTLTRLEALVDIVVDPSRTTRGAHLSLTTDSGLLETEAAPLPDCMPKQAVIAKFTRYAMPIIGPERGAALIAALLDGDLQRPIGPVIFQ